MIVVEPCCRKNSEPSSAAEPCDDVSPIDTFHALYSLGFADRVPKKKREERAKRLCSQLDAVAEAPEETTLYWIESEEGEDQGAEYCHECALKESQRLSQEQGCEWTLFRGDGSEEDHPCFCEICGIRLRACLTDYGAGELVAHFATYQDEVLDRVDAWELSRVLPQAALIKNIHIEFDCVCSWLETLFDRGAIAMPEGRGVCRLDLTSGYVTRPACGQACRSTFVLEHASMEAL